MVCEECGPKISPGVLITSPRPPKENWVSFIDMFEVNKGRCDSPGGMVAS